MENKSIDELIVFYHGSRLKVICYLSLRTLILRGINFWDLREFYPYSQKQVFAKFLKISWKLIFAKWIFFFVRFSHLIFPQKISRCIANEFFKSYLLDDINWHVLLNLSIFVFFSFLRNFEKSSDIFRCIFTWCFSSVFFFFL